MEEVMNLPEPGPFGDCPACGKNDGYRNVGREHWFYCDEHKVRWIAGVNLFSSWWYESEQDWEHNWALLREYEEVEPWLRQRPAVAEALPEATRAPKKPPKLPPSEVGIGPTEHGNYPAAWEDW
jgi:hypothetical protein